MPDIEGLAAYSVKPIAKRFFNHFTGITTNQIEGLNNLLKLICDRVELPLDVVILSLNQLSVYYCNEIKFGFGNRGNYRLRPEFKEKFFLDTRFINTRETMEPSEIVKSLIADKNELLQSCGVKFTTISNSEDSSIESDLETIASSKLPSLSNSLIEANDDPRSSFCEILSTLNDNVLNVHVENDDVSQKTLTQSTKTSSTLNTITSNTSDDDDSDIENSPFELRNRYNSKISRALWFVNNGKVKLDTALKIYFVTDEKNNCYQVKLLPKATCTCLEKNSCCHILAVQSINGIEPAYKIPNLTDLTKAKNSGVTGRKKKAIW